MSEPEQLPVPDTTDLRVGAELHERMLALLPLVGVWRGSGTGLVPSTGNEFRYGQQVTFAHDGRPFLSYESRTWLMDTDNSVIRIAQRESGFWRPGTGQDDIEALIITIVGVGVVLAGQAGDLHWELASTATSATPTAQPVGGEKRLYVRRGDDLLYATELSQPQAPTEFHPHLNGSLHLQ